MHTFKRVIRAQFRSAAALSLALVLSACKTFSPDGGMGVVAGFASDELKKDVVAIRNNDDALSARAAVERLLKRPLTADAAVQIALLNNRGLQAAYNALGIAEADMVAASLPPNPTLSVERLSNFAEIEIERRIIANILALATLPIRADIAADRFRQAQLRAAEETLRVAAETRRAYYRAVAHRELLGFLTQAQSSAETATQLALRLGESGAMNKLDQVQQQVFYAHLTAQYAAVRQRSASDRERLVRLLGLWGSDLEFRLPNALPALPRIRTLPFIEVEAIRRRVDLQVARIELDALVKSLGLTQATRFINLLEVAGIRNTVREREHGETVRTRGYDIEFQIPIFDFGEVRVRQAENTYMHAVNRLAEKAINVRSEARDAYRNYRSMYDIAMYYRREVLPLHKIKSDEMLLRYNAMQIDVFVLLDDARRRIAATTFGIEAHRDFWLTATDLSVAVVGGGIGGLPGAGPGFVVGAEAGAPGH